MALRPEPFEAQLGLVARQLEKHGYTSLGGFRHLDRWVSTKRIARLWLAEPAMACG